MSISFQSLTAGLLLLALASCSGDASHAATSNETQAPQRTSEPESYQLTPASAKRHGIEVAAAGLRVMQRHLIAPARVAFNDAKTGHIGSPLRGRVAAAPVVLGANVAQGDVLVVVDSPDLGEAQIELLLRRSAAESARPQVAFALESWQRAKALLEESQGVSLTEVARREAEHARLSAVVREAEVAVTAAQNRLAVLGMQQNEIDALLETGTVAPQLTIRAPFAGKVVVRDVTLGELVSPDRSMLMTIADVSEMWVMVAVPESRLGDATIGATATVLIGDEAGTRFDGEVALIAPTVDSATRTAEVRVVVKKPAESLRPGMFVTAHIAIPIRAEDQGGTLTVPETAVQNIDRQTVVFVPVAGKEFTYRMRPVEIGPAVDGFVPIRAGLQAGEQVVTTGSFVLKAQATQSGGDEGDN
jgi:membrane fusion protein, heavy metal efflux system